MTDSEFRKISIAGIVLLVVLRLSIGWQLLYEGLWKLQTEQTSQPWSAEPYLKNAQGPLRNYFRSLTGDPNDLWNLDYDTVADRWDRWSARFAAHYGLTEAQQQALKVMLDGPATFERGLEVLPPGVELPQRKDRGLYYDAARKRLVVDGLLHMTPKEKQDALAQVNFNEQTDDLNAIESPVVKKYVDEIQKIYIQQARLSYKEKALAILKGDPDYVGTVDPNQKGTVDERRLGKIEIYRNRLQRFEEKLANVKTHFDQDHLDYDWREIQQMRAQLVGPIRALESDFKWNADKLLTTDQLARGPLPVEMTAQRDIDLKTMWGLTILGGLLIAGLATRVAALGAAVMLFNFYMAYPPLPGYPTPPGPEHAYIINKNLIEVIVLLAFVFLPSGRWFGVDAIFAGMFTSKPPDDRR